MSAFDDIKAEKELLKSKLADAEAELEFARLIPYFGDFPPIYVQEAFRIALQADRPESLVGRAEEICIRWMEMPWLPDAPPVHGQMKPCPQEHPPHPPAWTKTDPMVPVGRILDKMNRPFPKKKQL